MVNCRTALLAVCVSGFSIASAPAAPRTLHVAHVHVEKTGIWRADPNGQETAEQCGRFLLSPAEALHWFRHAREVTKHAWLEELDWTQCSAKGTLVTDDGHSHPWELDQSGRGRVELSPSMSVYLGGPELPFPGR